MMLALNVMLCRFLFFLFLHPSAALGQFWHCLILELDNLDTIQRFLASHDKLLVTMHCIPRCM